ncbi:MAG: T9SS type A sorting domain-containing protein [Saprospiraceae bacterium]
MYFFSVTKTGLQQINLTELDLPTGIYFLQFEVDGVVVTEKVYIQN